MHGRSMYQPRPLFQVRVIWGESTRGLKFTTSEIGNGEMASEPSYKYLPRPDNASSMSPSDARALFRRNGYYGPTAGFCLGHAQTNVAIMPKEFSEDFEEFCKRNSGPLPLLYRSGAGEIGAPPLATDSNVR